jgi:hypothetical protein
MMDDSLLSSRPDPEQAERVERVVERSAATHFPHRPQTRHKKLSS